ncbi:resolvase, N domain-containing protein [Streptomyces laurentii]|uniref:Resolvase, N domain-containing protein n=1 Tax=Streptomyces laurentii TaxID=39478 RepID=A0A160NVL1_STRLU|nr:resolvase, N domain-containing protein [Streptomyces laurentii]
MEAWGARMELRTIQRRNRDATPADPLAVEGVVAGLMGSGRLTRSTAR